MRMHHVHPPAVNAHVLIVQEKETSHEKTMDDGARVSPSLCFGLRLQVRASAIRSARRLVCDRVGCGDACI